MALLLPSTRLSRIVHLFLSLWFALLQSEVMKHNIIRKYVSQYPLVRSLLEMILLLSSSLYSSSVIHTILRAFRNSKAFSLSVSSMEEYLMRKSFSRDKEDIFPSKADSFWLIMGHMRFRSTSSTCQGPLGHSR